MLRIWSQRHRGVGWILLQKRKILGQMWNQRERQHAITKSPMSVQHTSAMFITKNGPTTRLISINSWLWQPMHGTCHDQLGWNWNANPLLGSNQIIGFLLSHRLMFQVPSPRPHPCAHAGTPRPHPVKVFTVGCTTVVYVQRHYNSTVEQTDFILTYL